MSDPLTDLIRLLRPVGAVSKLVRSTGSWRVRRDGVGKLYHNMTLCGGARLEVTGKQPIELVGGDFVLIPEAFDFTVSSITPPPLSAGDSVPTIGADRTVEVGGRGPFETQQLVGYCSFDSPDAATLLRMLPDLIVVRGQPRLATLATLIRDEVVADRPARDLMLEHLLQLLLIEALRSDGEALPLSGLLGGLADPRLAAALRALHADPARTWTIGDLANEAAMSRSAFFAHFRQRVGRAPMRYLIDWRMAVAKDLLTRERASLSVVARRVGYGSASAFNAAFTRSVGCPPSRFARREATSG